MSPSSTSEARKRREGDISPGPTPLPGYVLCLYPEAFRAGSEIIDACDTPMRAGDLAGADWLLAADPPGTGDLDWLVIARPPRPRMVTIELPADVRDRWAGGPDGMVLTTDPAAITAACRASRDADQ